MKVVIIGATGTIGTQVVKQALDAECEVTAFARTPSKLTIESPRLRVVQGDALRDRDQIKAAVSGQDAVIITLGSAGLTGQVRSEGTRNIITSMKAVGTHRLICQSTLGAGDSSSMMNFKWRLLFFGPLRWVLADHEIQESYVRESERDWTIVRPSAFTDGPVTGEYKHGSLFEEKNLAHSISRGDVAHFLVKQLYNNGYRCRSVSLSC